MRFVARKCPALVLLVCLAGPAAADPVEDLTKLVQDAANSPNPAMAFLRGVAAMPDFSLGQAEIRRALAAANLPPGGVLHKLLGPTTRLVKDGDQVSVNRSQSTKVVIPGGGAVELGKKVRVRMRLRGNNDAVLDPVDGIKVGESVDDLYDLKSVEFTRQGGRPVAKVTAGVLFFTKTVTIDLTPLSSASGGGGGPTASAVPLPRRRPESTGFTGAINR